MYVCREQIKSIMGNLTINMAITSKYPEVCEAVRANQAKGMCTNHAVEKAVNDFKYKFQSDEDEAILLSWFSGKFAA